MQLRQLPLLQPSMNPAPAALVCHAGSAVLGRGAAAPLCALREPSLSLLPLESRARAMQGCHSCCRAGTAQGALLAWQDRLTALGSTIWKCWVALSGNAGFGAGSAHTHRTVCVPTGAGTVAAACSSCPMLSWHPPLQLHCCTD